jgi:hypothetical protein
MKNDTGQRLTVVRGGSETEFVPGALSRCLTVLDNAHYHCSQIDKSPTVVSRKGDIHKLLEGDRQSMRGK